VLEWHVSEGDQIAEGDTIVEVSTDKVDAEVPAPASGTVTKILVGPDETVEVGKPLAEMATQRKRPRSRRPHNPKPLRRRLLRALQPP
jgi:pyruvate/2-oxoglutarate dehydrogenase complex dihydrolipoamide acyltransferase (E2) component